MIKNIKIENNAILKFKNSNLSIELLNNLFNNLVDVNNDSIYINDNILSFNDKILIPFNENSKKIKRNEKDKYEYIDFFNDKEQQEYFLSLFFNINENFKQIIIRKYKNYNLFKLVDNENNLLFMERYEISLNNNNTIDFLCRYYEII